MQSHLLVWSASCFNLNHYLFLIYQHDYYLRKGKTKFPSRSSNCHLTASVFSSLDFFPKLRYKAGHTRHALAWKKRTELAALQYSSFDLTRIITQRTENMGFFACFLMPFTHERSKQPHLPKHYYVGKYNIILIKSRWFITWAQMCPIQGKNWQLCKDLKCQLLQGGSLWKETCLLAGNHLCRSKKTHSLEMTPYPRA